MFSKGKYTGEEGEDKTVDGFREQQEHVCASVYSKEG